MRIGLVRPEARDALGGCAKILHAGDLCSRAVLEELESIAPVLAVRGTNDRGTWADALPERLTVELGGLRIHVVHDLAALDLAAEPRPIDLVLTGAAPTLELVRLDTGERVRHAVLQPEFAGGTAPDENEPAQQSSRRRLTAPPSPG